MYRENKKQIELQAENRENQQTNTITMAIFERDALVMIAFFSASVDTLQLDRYTTIQMRIPSTAAFIYESSSQIFYQRAVKPYQTISSHFDIFSSRCHRDSIHDSSFWPDSVGLWTKQTQIRL